MPDSHDHSDFTPSRTVHRTAARIAAGLRSSSRKVRSDAGQAKGPLQPRRPPCVTYSTRDGAELAHVTLAGPHGQGRSMTLDRADWEAISACFDGGRTIHVMPNRTGCELVVWLQGPAAAQWAGTTDNPRHMIPAARFIAGERSRRVLVRYRDHSPFNLARSNLVLEDRRTMARSLPDWTMVEAGR